MYHKLKIMAIIVMGYYAAKRALNFFFDTVEGITDPRVIRK